jgi:hypothetical protein
MSLVRVRAAQYTIVFFGVFSFFVYIFPVFIPPWLSFYHECLAVLSCLFLVLLLTIYSDRCVFGVVSLFSLCVALIPLFQWTLGVIYFFGDAALASAYLLCFALVTVCGDCLKKRSLCEKASLFFSSLYFLLSFINVFFAINQYFYLNLAEGFLAVTDSRPYGNLGQPNNFASVLVISFLCGWYLFEKYAFSRKVYYLWVFYICIGLVLAQSRTTLLVGLCLTIFYLLFYRKIAFRAATYDFLWIAVCYASLYIALPLLRQVLLGDVDGGLREITVYDAARLSIWYESFLAIVNGPLWGYGWNQIGVAQVLVESDLGSAIHFRHAHNLFLDLLLYNGPVLGSVLICAIVLFAWRAFINCRTLEGWVVLAIIGSVFIHAMLEFPLHYAYFLLPVAFFVGLVDVPAISKCANAFSIVYPSWLNIPVVAIGAVLLVIIWRDYTIIHKEHFTLGIELNGVFERNPSSEKTKNILLLTQRREYLDFGRAEAVVGMSDADVEWMKKVSHRFPSPYYLSKYAKACQLNGRYEEADRVLRVVKRLFGEEMHVIAKREVYGGAAAD